MKCCQNCGNAMLNEDRVCSQCGLYSSPYVKDEAEGSKVGYGILAFFIPVVGLVLYILWKKEKPATARAAGKGALISFVSGLIFYIVIMVCSVLFFSSEMDEMEDYIYEDYFVEDVYLK